MLELHAAGVIGRGEAAPLPGYSRDTLATCEAELEGCADRLGEIDVHGPPLEVLRLAVARASLRAPAAVFALETALLDLVSKIQGRPAWALLRGDDQARPIPLSAIAEGATPALLADAAQRAQQRGIQVVKLKVGGPESASRDPERLAAVRTRVGPRMAIRLDANQTLSADHLEEALAMLATFGPELIEEPSTPERSLALRASPIPFAFDESLMLADWRARIAQAATHGTYRAVVLKPMVLGGFVQCLAIADAARERGLAVAVTHVFDGPIGSAAAACLALAIRGEVLPCGLDAHGRLERSPAAITDTHIVPTVAAGLGIEPLL